MANFYFRTFEDTFDSSYSGSSATGSNTVLRSSASGLYFYSHIYSSFYTTFLADDGTPTNCPAKASTASDVGTNSTAFFAVVTGSAPVTDQGFNAAYWATQGWTSPEVTEATWQSEIAQFILDRVDGTHASYWPLDTNFNVTVMKYKWSDAPDDGSTWAWQVWFRPGNDSNYDRLITI